MPAHIFDGTSFAKQKEDLLKKKIQALGLKIRIKTIVFKEDPAGMLYTRLKQEIAERVGISFEPEIVSINDPIDQIKTQVFDYSNNPQIQGVMIQKPMKSVWPELTQHWSDLVSAIDPAKDVDCLTPTNQSKIYQANWQILPATAQAVISILEYVQIDLKLIQTLKDSTIVVLGKSEIVGKPVAAVLRQLQAKIKNFGREVDLEKDLKQAEILVSAIGQKEIIKGEYLKADAIIIDIGSPGPDVEFVSASKTAKFITPVPYGVGPVTVVSLMKNAFTLANQMI